MLSADVLRAVDCFPIRVQLYGGMLKVNHIDIVVNEIITIG